MATVGTLIFEMSANIARLQQDMAKAQGTVKSAMSSIESAVGLAKKALGGLGLATSVVGLEKMISGAIGAMASMRDLSLQTGITVETLSALKGVAKLAGTDLDTVAGMVNKLEKQMLAFAQDGGGKAANAFKQLGYSQEEVKKGLQNIDTFLPGFAKHLVETGVGGEQAGLAMQLMGKSGAAALPFLEQLAETGKLNAKITTQQAEAAKQFEDNMIRLQSGANGLKIALANELLPSLNAITEAMVRAKNEGGMFASVVAGIQTLFTGNDQYKAMKELSDLTDRQAELEKRIADQRAREKTGNWVQKFLFGDPTGIPLLQRQLDEVTARLKVVRDYKKMLDDESAKPDKPKPAALKEIEKAQKPVREAVDKQISEEELLTRNAIERQKMLYEMEEKATRAHEKQQHEADSAAAAAQKRAEAETAALDREAEGWKNLIDPSKQYFEQLERIVAMEEAGRLNAIQAEQARAIAMRNIDNALKGTEEAAAKTDDFANKLGLTMTSAFEKAVIQGQNLRKVLQGMAQDIMQIILRQQVTTPLGNWISGQVGGAGGDGGLGGFMSSIGSKIGGLFGGGGGGVPSPMDFDVMTAFPMAGGGDYLVNKPTLFLAGEAGPERATFSGAGNTGGGGGNTFHYHDNSGRLSAAEIERNAAVFVRVLKAQARNFVS